MVLLLHLSNIKSADVEFSGKLYGHYTHFSYISHKDVLLLKTLQHLPLLEDDGSLESCIILIPFLSVQSSISNYISNHIILGGGVYILMDNGLLFHIHRDNFYTVLDYDSG